MEQTNQKNQLKGRKDVNELEGLLFFRLLEDVDRLLLAMYTSYVHDIYCWFTIYKSRKFLNC